MTLDEERKREIRFLMVLISHTRQIESLKGCG